MASTPLALRRSPATGAATAVTLALAVGAGVPVLALVHAGLSRPLPCLDPLLCGPGQAPDWLARWTPDRQSMAEVQAEGFRTLLWIVAALALLLVGVALVNLLTLLLARASARGPELALRVALGAGSRRVAGQLLAEVARVMAPGLAAGAVAAAVGARLLEGSWPLGPAPWADASSPGPVAVGMAAALGLPALLAALSPAGIALRRDLRRFLGGGGRVTAGPGEVLLRDALSVAQVAGSLVLLTSAGLLLRSVASDSDSRPPPHTGTTLTVQLRLPEGASASAAERAAIYRRARLVVEALPGVVDSSVSTAGAWVGMGTTDRVTAVCPECGIGTLPKPTTTAPARMAVVSPGFFRSLGLRVLRGREFAGSDGHDAPLVAVINRQFAYRLIPNGEPLGKQIQLGDGSWYRVVGVVEDVAAQGIGAGAEPFPALYLPVAQHPPRAAGLAFRSSGDPREVLAAVAAAVRRASPGIHISGAMTMERYLDRYRSPMRWLGGLLAAVAAAVVVLAVLGLHALIRHNVARRTREIGIRMAVGASPRAVIRIIVRKSLRLCAVGAVAGLISTGGLARLLQLLVRGVELWDPALYGSLLALLVAMAILASYRPALAAAALDPQLALREE